MDKKIRKSTKANDQQIKKKRDNVKQFKSNDIAGISTLLVNTDVKEYVPVQEASSQQTDGKQGSSSKKKKQNKNKNKKKR